MSLPATRLPANSSPSVARSRPPLPQLGVGRPTTVGSPSSDASGRGFLFGAGDAASRPRTRPPRTHPPLLFFPRMCVCEQSQGPSSPSLDPQASKTHPPRTPHPNHSHVQPTPADPHPARTAPTPRRATMHHTTATARASVRGGGVEKCGRGAAEPSALSDSRRADPRGRVASTGY
jgi:hypothetical protein